MGFWNKFLKRNTEDIVVSQYFNKTADDWEVVEGSNGAFNVRISGASDDASGAIGTNLKASQIIQPVDIQARYSVLTQTHTAQAVAPSATSIGTWIDTNALNYGSALSNVSITVALSAAASHDLIAEWSHDGSVVHYTETKSGTGKDNGIFSDTKGQWLRVSVKNTGASPVTANAHSYFKA